MDACSRSSNECLSPAPAIRRKDLNSPGYSEIAHDIPPSEEIVMVSIERIGGFRGPTLTQLYLLVEGLVSKSLRRLPGQGV